MFGLRVTSDEHSVTERPIGRRTTRPRQPRRPATTRTSQHRCPSRGLPTPQPWRNLPPPRCDTGQPVQAGLVPVQLATLVDLQSYVSAGKSTDRPQFSGAGDLGTKV